MKILTYFKNVSFVYIKCNLKKKKNNNCVLCHNILTKEIFGKVF